MEQTAEMSSNKTRPVSRRPIKARPPSSTAIETQFQISRETCADISDSYAVAKQAKSQKVKSVSHSNVVRKGADKTKALAEKLVSRAQVGDDQYAMFESRRRPKSAKTHSKSDKLQRSKSTLPFARSVTPHTRSPTPRPSSVTLTPKTVTPRLTKCRDLNQKTNKEGPRPVFSAFKPKSSRSRSDEDDLPEFFKSGSRSPSHNERVLMSRSFASTPASNPGSAPPGSTSRQIGTPRCGSSKELFCNCPSGRAYVNIKYPTNLTILTSHEAATRDYEQLINMWTTQGRAHVNIKYPTNLTTLTSHEATTRDYEQLINMWTTQGLHWISCAAGEMCSRAVQGGHTRTGEPLYIARALTPDRNKCIGTFHPSTGLCYVPWKGKEIVTDVYELLCYRSRIQAPASLYSYTPTTNLVDTLKVLTLRDRRQTAFKC